jgi:predicted MFS family arabinose efflux permease
MSDLRRELRDGWRNLAAATIGIMTGIAAYIPISSLFFRAIETNFGWSKTASAASLLALPITAAALPGAGRLVDKLGVRRVVAVSITATLLAYLWLSQIGNSKAQFYMGFLALNVLGCATGPLAYSRLVVGDFNRARGTALAIALAGIACATIILPPLVYHIIAVYTWRGGYVFFACLTLAGGLTALLMMQPRSVPGPAARSSNLLETDGSSAKTAIVSGAFWFLGGAIFFISTGTIGLVSQLQSVLVEVGLSARVAAWHLSLLGFSVGISRLIMGRLLDLYSPARTTAVVLAVASLGALALRFGSGGRGAMALGVVLIGTSAGAELDIMAFFCSRLFGLRKFGIHYGSLFAFHYVGMAAGGIMYGSIYDRTGRYNDALMASFTALLISGGIFLLLDRFSARIAADSMDIEKPEVSHVAA